LEGFYAIVYQRLGNDLHDSHIHRDDIDVLCDPKNRRAPSLCMIKWSPTGKPVVFSSAKADKTDEWSNSGP
jgi:hypothetical protein